MIVSDTSLFDLNYLGQLGVIPGWPGADMAPAQPMVAQTRAVLRRHTPLPAAPYEEIAVPDCGHSAHLEHPDLVRTALLDHVSGT